MFGRNSTRNFTLLGGALILGAAGIAWWLRPYPPEVAAVSNLPQRPQSTTAAAASRDAPASAAAAVQRPDPDVPVAVASPPANAAVSQAARQGLAYHRQQMEKLFKVLYEDLGAAIGTSEYETSQLTGMLVDHYMQGREVPFEWNSMAALEQVRELRAEQRADLLAFLGESRLAALDKYEKSLGARREVADLVVVLGADSPVTEDQRRRLVRAAIDAHVYYDEPRYTGVESREALEQERLAKRQLVDAKMLDVARGVLTSEQMAAFESSQQERGHIAEGMLRKQRD